MAFRHRLTLAGAAGLALAFGLLCVLFIADPAKPAQINAWLTGGNARDERPLGTRLAETPSALDVDTLERLLREQIAPVEADREFVQSWHQRRFPKNPAQIKAVRDDAIFWVRQMELDNGERVRVFTKIDGEPDPRRVSY